MGTRGIAESQKFNGIHRMYFSFCILVITFRPMHRLIILALPLSIYSCDLSESPLHGTWLCPEGVNSGLFMVNSQDRVLYDFFDSRGPRYCRKTGAAIMGDMIDDEHYDWTLDHYLPETEEDYLFHVSPVPQEEWVSERREIYLEWDWTVRVGWDDTIRSDITVTCQYCSSRFATIGDCPFPPSPWPLRLDVDSSEFEICPDAGFDGDISE